MSANTLFAINSFGDFEINKVEAKKIEEYNALLVRDKGGIYKGDYDGRHKMKASMEIYYIYLVYDPRSLYYNLPVNERKLKARKDCKLPDNWKEDDLVLAAIVRYQYDFKLTAAGQAYIVAEKAYYTIAKDTEEIQDELTNLKQLLKTVSNKLQVGGPTKLGEGELTTLAHQVNAILGKISKTQKDIMTNISGFPKLQQTVKELATKFADEGGSMKIPVGGGTVGNREL